MTDQVTLERLLEQTIDTLQAAHRRQTQDTDPGREDFDRWGRALTAITDTLADVGDALIAQVSAHGRDRVLRDGAGGDPHRRLRTACDRLGALTGDLKAARHEARDYHATIGHIRDVPDDQPTRQARRCP